ncbi:ABC transporter permease [Sphingomonas sp. H160509]|uniref:ABC transporter permease n=1 Tax=Sphingomonas sp. H160509 TaxID=2955313 RepID=UPI00315914AF
MATSRRSRRHEPFPSHPPPDLHDRTPRLHSHGVHADLPAVPVRAADHGVVRRDRRAGRGERQWRRAGQDADRRDRPRHHRAADRRGRHAPARHVPQRRSAPELSIVAPTADPATQARAAFETKDVDASAVLYGPLDAPQILYGPRGKRSADYLGLLAQTTLAAEKLGGTLPTIAATKTQITRSTTSVGGQHQSAFFAVFGIFFLTLFLSGQVVGTMAEERNNKVIEVLAAAVPLESVFFGKLIGMFGVAVLFVAFWGTVVTQITSLMPAAAAVALGDLTPAVGAPMFALLFAAYFSMAYLLLGSVFLGVGAQATTMREIQMLSLPITILQVAMFGLSSAAVSHPGSWLATAAELFPLSSPFAMAGRAANSPELWPHVAALAWQALWVTIFITVGGASVPPRRAAIGKC